VQVRAAPVVYLDEAHHDSHTATGKFLRFAHLLEADGYRPLHH
jgi:hypothetical protein